MQDTQMHAWEAWTGVSLYAKAQQLLRMHQPGSELLIPNAWDGISARIFAEAGFPAIATTSAGIAYARGYPDGEVIPRDEMVQEVARIAAAVACPVTADMEAGYGRTPADVAETVAAVLEAGAVGANFEDATGDPDVPLLSIEDQAERIRAARAAADRIGVPFVINARTDTYLLRVGPEETRLAETVARGRAYFEAGADVVFVPRAPDAATIEALVQQLPGPLSVMAVAGGPSAPELFALGVRRVSIGPWGTLAAMGLMRTIAHELRDHGTYDALSREAYTYAEAQRLFQ